MVLIEEEQLDTQAIIREVTRSSIVRYRIHVPKQCVCDVPVCILACTSNKASIGSPFAFLLRRDGFI